MQLSKYTQNVQHPSISVMSRGQRVASKISQARELNLEVFGGQIDSGKFKTIIEDNITQGQYSLTIIGSFKLAFLMDQYHASNSAATEQKIKSLFHNRLIDSKEQGQHQASGFLVIDPERKYLMRKVGNLTSKQVQRECRFTPNGILQNKSGVETPMNIKSVIKMERRDGPKQLDIAWVKDPKYLFRVIMKDSKNLLRAVFAQTVQQAQQILDYCILFVPSALRIGKMPSRLSAIFRNKVVEQIGNKIRQSDQEYRPKSQIKRQSRGAVESNFVAYKPQQNQRQSQHKAQIQRDKVQAVRRLMQDSNIKYIDGLVSKWTSVLQRQRYQGGVSSLNVQSSDYMASALNPGGSKNTDRLSEQLRDFTQKFTLVFQRFQLMKQNEVMKKPVLTIKIVRGLTEIYSKIFDTILEKKDPYLVYQLFYQDQSQKLVSLEQQITKLTVSIQMRDRLSPQLIQASVPLRVKERADQLLYITPEDGTFRLQVRYIVSKREDLPIAGKGEVINEDGLVLMCKQIQPQDIQTIKMKYWSDGTKNQYYSEDISLDITQILGRLEIVPKFWWFGISEQEYQVLSLLEAASQSLSFVVIQAHLHIIRALIRIFQQSSRIVQRTFKSILSIIIYYMRPYYFRSYFDKVQDLHIGVGVDVNCDLSSKLSLELKVFNAIVAKELPELMEKYRNKNVHLGLILFEYLYEMYSRNFNLRVLIPIWNHLFKEVEKIQKNLLLLGVVLLKISASKLARVYRYPDIAQILTVDSKKYTNTTDIIMEIELLHKRYFNKPETFIQSIATKLLEESPFEQVVSTFYKRQNARLQANSSKKLVQKREVISRLIAEKQHLVIPRYEPKSHNLHIYFHKLPKLEGGMLSIRLGEVEYECVRVEINPYYILRNVNAPITLIYSFKGKRWSAIARMIQGVLFTSVELQEERDEKSQLTIEYTGGFLTTSQETAILKGKPSEHYLGSYMRLQNIVNECLREAGDCFFLKHVSAGKLPYQINQNIKILFMSGSNRFNDVDFYLSWILNLRISLLEKLNKVREYAESVWTELFHSSSAELYKIMLRQFLDKMNFPIEDTEYEFLYNATLEELDCPNIVNIKFINYDGKKVALGTPIHKHQSEKSSRSLLSDLIVSHKFALGVVLTELRDKLTTIDGVLVIKFSSSGKISKRTIPLKYSKQSKQLVVNNYHENYTVGTYQIKDVVPQLLAADFYPSFSRIAPRLYQQDSEASVVKSRYFKQQTQVASKHNQNQLLNVLKCVQDKIKCVIPLRYRSQYFVTSLPFLSYYSELLYKVVYNPLPKLYLNRVEVLPRKVCTFNGDLELSDNQRGENLPINKRLGLQGNITKHDLEASVVYFWPTKNQNSFKVKYPVFVNYGSGVFRTQQCRVFGYCRGNRNKNKLFMVVQLYGKTVLIPRQDLLLDSIDIFAEIDLTSEVYQRFQKEIKALQGKTEEERLDEEVESRKFTNIIKKEGDMFEIKNMSSYTKLYDKY